MKIKLYKLLEMIDKGEELPQKIIYNNRLFDLYNTDAIELIKFIIDCEISEDIIGLELETIEDTKIKPLEISDENGKIIDKNSDNYEYGDNCELLLATKINEIINILNKEIKDE